MARNGEDFVLQFGVDIHPSARKHGIADDDIENAIAKAFIVEPIDQDRMLYIGPDRTANFIEVVTLIRQDGSEITIHAMRMRRQYEKLLPGHD